MKFYENVPISSLTTMRLGGPARCVIDVERPEEVSQAYKFAHDNKLRVFVLGGGANSIGRDEGFSGAIIRNKILGMEIKVAEDNPEYYELRTMGGEVWDKVVDYACRNGLTGIEALSKIPGTAGAAPVQNIGAYGQDISQVLKNVEVFDLKDWQYKVLPAEQLNFKYRSSILNTTEFGRYFVIGLTLRLRKGQMQRPFYNSLEAYIQENNESDFSPASIRRMVSEIRAEKLPDPMFIPSAGSFFKNVYIPTDEIDECQSRGIKVHVGADGNKINTGWLIEQAGLSGKLIHGFRINPKASLVLINESARSYADLVAARNEIATTIYDKFGFRIEQEPVEIM